MIAALVAVFIVSGAAGLIYESIWSRYLGLFVGHSAYAQIIVLVIFLGGMSLGAWLAGERSSRVRSPLLWYAGVEIVVGLLAVLFHDIYQAGTGWAYASVFPHTTGAGLTAAKWAIACALILPQSILLGTTFPLMSAGVIRMARAGQSPGRILGLLYFANSLGAAVGVLLSGFVLIAMLGLPGTLLVAGFMNVIAGLAAGLIARAHERVESAERASAARPAEAPQTGMPEVVAPPIPRSVKDANWYPLLIVSFGTAVASFIYEIAWIRMLSLVLGSATHSFELMLSAFILGLALGALWIRGRADRIADPIHFLGVVQWVMGILAIATLPLYIASFEWMSLVLGAVQENASGYRVFQLARYAFALIIMLPATFCAGMTLPLITKVLMRGGAGERAIGSVYAWNTLGSILGVALAGLVLMPWLGLKTLLVVGAALDIILGIWLIVRARRASGQAAIEGRFADGPPLAIPLIATVAILVAIAFVARFDLVRLTSGVYRHGIVERTSGYEFPFYKDGRTATVSVRRSVDGFVTLSTNGKPDASMEREWMDTTRLGEGRRELRRDIATQLLLPIISLAHAPQAANIAIIGHGSGMSSHVLLGSPHVREAVTIEIEPEMINASRVFQPANDRVFTDSRSTFVIDDAKSYFAASGRQFDLILSEPSNPWVSGVSGLFTEEFYQRVKLQLAPNGVFGQWLHLYELSDVLVTSVLAAIDKVFPAYEVFYTSNADILVVASNTPLRQPDWSVTEFAGIARDMRRVLPMRAETFEALRLGGRDVLHPIVLGHGAPNSDFFPTLDLGAERMRFMHESADGYMELTSGRFDVVAALTGRRAAFGTLTLSAVPEVERPTALALGTQLRAMRTMDPAIAAQLPRSADLRAAMHRRDMLDRMIQSGQPPVDWHEFVASVVKADADLHSGTAGVIDTAFFARTRAFVSRGGAPAEARAAVDFLQGIGSWNWPLAAVASQTLIASTDTVEWIPDVLLRNGAAVSYIMLRDTTNAKEVLRTFARRTFDDPFRERMIASFLVYSDTTLRRRRGWQ
ncbi:MAG TPA: fused MFS/spermidine synthase [Gemmatimonadaceae bacterium]|nr:fused MFS/spermidine synthase [Gemmatimonadaceae bacterium]